MAFRQPGYGCSIFLVVELLKNFGSYNFLLPNFSRFFALTHELRGAAPVSAHKQLSS
jgi:hypothetical protein